MIIDPQYEAWQQEEFLEACKDKGITIFVPEDYQLILDMDTQEQMDRLPAKIERLNIMLARAENAVEVVSVDPSTTTGHKHVLLELNAPLDVARRVAIQMFLGSDPVKEFLSLERIRAGISPATLLAKGNWKERLNVTTNRSCV